MQIPNRSELFFQNTFTSNDLSPVLKDDFIGIRIFSPEPGFENGNLKIPIHGSFRFKSAFRNRFESLNYEMAIVAVDSKSHTPIISNLQNRNFVPLRRKIEGSKTADEETTIGGWFNTDLTYFLKTPLNADSSFYVFAIIGEEKSNVVTIRLGEK